MAPTWLSSLTVLPCHYAAWQWSSDVDDTSASVGRLRGHIRCAMSPMKWFADATCHLLIRSLHFLAQLCNATCRCFSCSTLTRVP